ncbi:MAG: DUF421 domain-containing protein [Butyricicoccus pullicaecorum]|jgi:uncharacterized membrane protein YcaP (DUF421 family)|nr:DUF421 domain-containing protein [Butyricicoccus pullicaecorum]
MVISFFRTFILYAAIVVALRLMGKRQIGELEPSELVITILVSELASIPMQDVTVPLFAGLIPIFTLVSLEILVSFLCLKSRRMRRLFNGRSAVIIRGGKFDQQKMRELRLTTDEIIETLRQNNISSPSDLKCAVIEPSGQLSYVLKPAKQPVTAEMLSLTPPGSGLPLIVVSDGKPVPSNLKLLHLEVSDLEKRLKKANVPCMTDVFLMTLDDCGNQFIQRKEG